MKKIINFIKSSEPSALAFIMHASQGVKKQS
jgi:hypothetical protein